MQRLYATGYGTTGWQQFFDTLSPATGNNDYYYSGSTDGVNALTPQPQPDTTIAFYTRAQQLTQTLAQWKSLHAARDADQDSRWITTYTGQPLVVVEPAAAYRQETSGTVDGWIVRRVARDLASPLTIHLSTAGTATPGVHYEALPASIVIPAEARQATVPFTPLLSGEAYGEHTVTLVVAPAGTYVTPDPSASFTLEDAVTAGQPRVSVAATTPIASEEGPTPGEFTLTRTSSTATALTVNYTIGGTAEPSRYQALSGQAVFSAGSDITTVAVIPINDAVPQLSETITLNIESGAGYIPSLQDPISATITLRDNDIVSPVDVTLPPGNDVLVIPVTLRNPAAVDQTFTVTSPGASTADYVWNDSTQSEGPSYEWIDIHAIAGRTEISELRGQDDATTQYANGQSGATGGIPLGFSFPFFTGSYDQLWLNSNGLLEFGERSTNSRYANQPLPNTTSSPGHTSLTSNATSAHLLFFWDDLLLTETAPAARAYYARPDPDTFVLTVENFRHYSRSSVRLTAQIILKSDGEIRVNYQDVTIPYNLGSTIGLQGSAAEGHPYVQVSYNNDYVQSGMSLRFRRPIQWLSTLENTFQVVVPAGSTATFELTFDAAGLPEGLLSSSVLLSSDHPNQPVLILPVSFNIAEAAPPSPPINLTALSTSDSTVTLSWSDIADNETGQRIERAPASEGTWMAIASLPSNAETHLDTGLISSTTYYYRIFAFNEHGDSIASNLAAASTLILSSPPTIQPLPDFTPASSSSAHYWIQTDQEIRAHFGETGEIDDVPGSIGEGWISPWTLVATDWQTTSSIHSSDTAPLWAGAGAHIRLDASNTGNGKRALVARGYGDTPTARVALDQPQRIVLHLRVDAISGFASTNDRLYVWDRNAPSNQAHFSEPETMSWGFLTAGVPREWRYYGPDQLSTGIPITQGHVYRFVIETDPAQNNWRFELTDLNTGTSYTSPDWHPFRNTAQAPGAVGGYLHAGAFLDSSPQEVALSLDSIIIRARDLSFSASGLPAGWALNPDTGLLSGTASSSDRFNLSVTNLYGSQPSSLAYGPFANWQELHFTANELSDALLRSSLWGKTADPDGDGLVNLLEYAVASDPWTASSQPLVLNDEGSGLQLRFHRARNELNYSIVRSPDLSAPWALESLNPGNLGTTVTVPITPDDSSHFYRLKISE